MWPLSLTKRGRPGERPLCDGPIQAASDCNWPKPAIDAGAQHIARPQVRYGHAVTGRYPTR